LLDTLHLMPETVDAGNIKGRLKSEHSVAYSEWCTSGLDELRESYIEIL